MRRNKILSIILYFLPILFFVISYFLITTSGEDIHQGANSLNNGTPVNFIEDATNAFNHSGRITDMYAWTVIDLFDYQFKFGIDTIFRLLDVIAITSALWLATYIILSRKPKLQIKDALIFCAVFVAIVFSLFGRRLYSEFSMIHNYVPLVLITLLFSIPYLRLLLKNPPLQHHLAVPLLLLGFLFGMSTTITPVAFLVTVIFYLIVERKRLSRPPTWFYTGLVGIVIGFCISFFLSPGMNNYATNPISAETFDYVSISDFFSAPLATLPRLLFHTVYNFGMVLLPLFIIFIIAVIFSKSYRLVFTKHPLRSLSPSTRHLLFTFCFFIFIHTLATIQIKSPPRILIPAYLAGVILIFKIFTPHIKSRLLGIAIAILAIIALVLHTIFLSLYHIQSAAVLDEIKSSPSSELCIARSRIEAPRLPLINLSQEFILVDWGYPEPIYNKNITFCKNQ